MLAKDYKVGDKFNHINCGVITVIEIDGEKVFINKDGDIFKYTDDDFIER